MGSLGVDDAMIEKVKGAWLSSSFSQDILEIYMSSSRVMSHGKALKLSVP